MIYPQIPLPTSPFLKGKGKKCWTGVGEKKNGKLALGKLWNDVFLQSAFKWMFVPVCYTMLSASSRESLSCYYIWFDCQEGALFPLTVSCQLWGYCLHVFRKDSLPVLYLFPPPHFPFAFQKSPQINQTRHPTLAECKPTVVLLAPRGLESGICLYGKKQQSSIFLPVTWSK